ncbi:PAAR domain-containing protein [Rugamonas sp. CCM 8940]|uniref:PAAR domain-containing protein n=1 Tax=Rugamonas sp. CCM 8940 TaxID=2765359 RepID=UPI00361015E7
MPKVIRLGDPTSHGGKVLESGAPHFTVGDISVVVVGDRCICPIPGHGNCRVAEGDPNHTIDGKAVAYQGHKTTCGAALISTVANFYTE